MFLRERPSSTEVPKFGRLGIDGAPRILIVDDVKVHRMILSRIAEKVGFKAVEAESCAEVVRVLSVGVYQGATIDLSLGEQAGTAVLKELAHAEFPGWIVVISGSSPSVTDDALELGRNLGLDMIGSVPKPVDIAALRSCFAEMLGR